MPVPISASRQDLSNVMTFNEIKTKHNFNKFNENKWHWKSACAILNESLYQGIE